MATIQPLTPVIRLRSISVRLPDASLAYRPPVPAATPLPAARHTAIVPAASVFLEPRAHLNHDGHVTVSDFITLASNSAKINAVFSDIDLNYDNQISISDFIDPPAHFNQSLPSSAPMAALP